MPSERRQHPTERLAQGSSRRGFLSRVGKAVIGLAAGGAVASGLGADDAEGFHFCGHIFTTGSCPHPTGLPRIDAHGMPLRARDGKPIDNLGRPIDRQGHPVDEQGRRLVDLAGRPMPPAPRTPVCEEVALRFDIPTQVDGSWYRCCGGRVRKLMDCCSTHQRRINGDRALTGYCYEDRKVFCVMYYDTKVPC